MDDPMPPSGASRPGRSRSTSRLELKGLRLCGGARSPTARMGGGLGAVVSGTPTGDSPPTFPDAVLVKPVPASGAESSSGRSSNPGTIAHTSAGIVGV